MNNFNKYSELSFFNFDQLYQKSKEIDGSIEVFHLHQGKIALEFEKKIKHWDAFEFPYQPHQHTSPLGVDLLREQIKEYLWSRFKLDVCIEQIMVTAGATHGLSIILHTIISPGDEVLILSPQWLFMKGVVVVAGGKAVEVPLFFELYQDKQVDIEEIITPFINKKTKAIYFNTPNNPTGIQLTRKQLMTLGGIAEKYNLYILSDNAYEQYDYSAEGFIDIRQVYQLDDKFFSIFSFSKTNIMPGFRIGFSLIPKHLHTDVAKASLYTLYALPTISQYMAYNALCDSILAVKNQRLIVDKARKYTMENLAVPHSLSEGGFYTYLDFSNIIERYSHTKIMNRFNARGVFLAPGEAFSQDGKNFARLCYSSVNIDKLTRAIPVINDIYEEMLKS